MPSLSRPKTITLIITALLLVIVGVIFFTTRLPPLTVESTNPSNNAKFLPTNTLITIAFNLIPTVTKNIRVESVPSATFKASWSKQFLVLEPTLPLPPNTLMAISIYQGKTLVHQFSFTTSPYTSQEIDKQNKQQAADDFITGKAELQAQQTMPWITALPIETENYRVVYDYELKKLRIRLLAPIDTKIIFEQLNSLHIPYQQIGYNIIALPK